jgi:transposase
MIRLTDEQWERVQSHFPEEHIADGRPGRKPIPTRRVLEAVLWLLNTGAQWHMLPQSYPNYKTVHRRFHAWCRDEILRRLLTDVANELRDRGALDEEECFIDPRPLGVPYPEFPGLCSTRLPRYPLQAILR